MLNLMTSICPMIRKASLTPLPNKESTMNHKPYLSSSAGSKLAAFKPTLLASIFGGLCVLPFGAFASLSPDVQVSTQQQAWQDAIKQQRIAALRNSKAEDQLQEDGDKLDQALQPQKTKPPINSVPPVEPVIIDGSPAACLPTSRITLGNIELLSGSVAAKLKASAAALSQGDCISDAQANALARSITQAYMDAGYFKVAIKPQLLANGTAHWQLHVARVVDIDNQTDLPTSRLFGDIVTDNHNATAANIAWLDQAVGHAERVIDGRLLLDIYPVGDDVRLVVSQQGDIDKISGDIELNRDATDSYDHFKIKAHGTLRNVLGQADVTSLSLQQSLTDDFGYDKTNQRRSASIHTSIPNGRWQWSGLLAGNEYRRTTDLPNSVLEQSGDSWQANVRGDYTLGRDQRSITTAYGQVAHQDVNAEVLGSQIDTQSPTITSARVGVSRTQLFHSSQQSSQHPGKASSGAWVLDLSAEKAFGGHDNAATESGLSDDYWRILLSGYLTHQHSLAKGGYMQLTHELQGQYSDNQLFGIVEQSLGSTFGGVRGISNASSSAATGVALRNTLSFEPSRSNWVPLGHQQLRWSPYVGVDYGVLKNAETSETTHKRDSAYSGTLGLTLTGYDTQKDSLSKRWQLDGNVSRARTDYSAKQSDKLQDPEVTASFQLFF